MSDLALKTYALSFAYDEGNELFCNVDFELHCGEIAVICGSSGCGKSTFCQCRVGIIPEIYDGYLTGKRELFGVDVATLRLPDMADRLFMVFQEPGAQLFSPTIEDELCFAPENLCWEHSLIEQKLTAALEKAGMSAFRYASPNELSGGQQQKIALACAFTVSPRLYIFDEALSQLDKEARLEMLVIIKQLAAEGNAVLMIEHSRENMHIADKIYKLEQKQLILQPKE
ncbi:MAG: ABC transporter ATP-binding protein [Firmicutes bacterium]|nr:ABC transporter ATP-binding protein [Bacillota bacterium]